MVTQVIETGARAPSNSGNNFWSKVTYLVGLGCCMNERKPRASTINTPTRSPLDEIKTGDLNWSTSTLGIETDLRLQSEGGLRSDSSMALGPRDIPLSSFEFYLPTPASPPPVARPQSRPARQQRRRGTDSPVITITDYDIATGTTPSTGECQREREERRQRKKRKPKRDREKVSTVQAWSQVDPLYGIYQRELDRERDREQMRRDAASQGRSTGRYTDIRAFDFMSYGGWIVI
jgi:hypothetical protein